MTLRAPVFALTLLLSLPLSSLAQTDPPPTPPTPPPAVESASPSILSRAASSSYERRESFPNVNIYLPEGQASIRLRKLIKNVLFESQIDYKFVNGDISTYLRYKYYARNYTYKIGVFDTIEFPDVGTESTQEFERVRGGLLLVGIPRNYTNRYFWLLQNDRLTFGDLEDVDNKRNNIYTKIGYQFGTQFDERLNGIVGESRGRITPVLTAFRDIGPQKTGFAGALTQSSRVATGDYQYTKIEAEALRRFDVSGRSFVFSRLHVGSFFGQEEIRDETYPDIERYSIPRYEMFKLGGREAIKAVSDDEDSRGSHEIHMTNEYFQPIFRNRDYRFKAVHLNTMYGIAYVGAGSVGFEFGDIGKSDHFVVDAGLGSEMAFTIRDFEVLISVVFATTLQAPDTLAGDQIRFSIRTIR